MRGIFDGDLLRASQPIGPYSLAQGRVFVTYIRGRWC